MSITRTEYEAILNARKAFLDSPEGRRALRATLACLGLFRSRQDWRALADKPERFTAMVLQSLLTLADLGVLVEDNFGPLVDAMAALPMPACD